MSHNIGHNAFLYGNAWLWSSCGHFFLHQTYFHECFPSIVYCVVPFYSLAIFFHPLLVKEVLNFSLFWQSADIAARTLCFRFVCVCVCVIVFCHAVYSVVRDQRSYWCMGQFDVTEISVKIQLCVHRTTHSILDTLRESFVSTHVQTFMCRYIYEVCKTKVKIAQPI